MKAKSRYVYLYKYVLVIALLGAVLGITTQAEAVLTPQSISGSVEVLVPGEQNWKPLTPDMALNKGDQVQTGPGGAVELWFEDGSVFKIGEDTKLTLSELDISSDRKTRVSRVKLLWGTITAKITKLGVSKSVCEIETDTVVAGIKFSQMTLIKMKDGSAPDKVLAEQGLTEIQQIAEGMVNVSALLDGEEGLHFTLNALGATVSLNVQGLLRKITLLSDILLTDIKGLVGMDDNFLKVDNLGDTPTTVSIQNNVTIVEPESQATIGIPSDQLLLIETTKGAFTFQQRKPLGDNVITVFNVAGEVSLNGEPIQPGAFQSAPLTGGGQSRTLQKDQQKIQKEGEIRSLDSENPVEPQQAVSSSDGGGEPQVPTPIPTVEPTEIPEEEPAPAPTPTPKPTPTKTPVPEPTETPRPDYRPGSPPKPTQTPASPVQPVP